MNIIEHFWLIFFCFAVVWSSTVPDTSYYYCKCLQLCWSISLSLSQFLKTKERDEVTESTLSQIEELSSGESSFKLTPPFNCTVLYKKCAECFSFRDFFCNVFMLYRTFTPPSKMCHHSTLKDFLKDF